MEELTRICAYQSNSWVIGVIGTWLSDPECKCHVLSGDAGCGKSTTLRLLNSELDKLGLAYAFIGTATMHKACAALPGSVTYHSAIGMGRDRRMLSASPSVFAGLFNNAFGNLVAHAAKFSPEHACVSYSSRCARCVRELSLSSRELSPPHMWTKSLIVVDEYAVMDTWALKKLLTGVNKFQVGNHKPHFVFCGSVSQLISPTRAPPGGKRLCADDPLPLYQSALLPSIISTVTNLIVNNRQFEDPVFGFGLKMMQFNAVTKPFREICKAACVGETKAMDPTYLTQVPRIFNANATKSLYIERHAKLFAKPMKLRAAFIAVPDYQGAKIPIKDAVEMMTARFPKVFTRSARPEHTTTGTVYLYVGAGVTVLPKGPTGVLKKMCPERGLVLDVNGLTVEVPKRVEYAGQWRFEFYNVMGIVGLNTYDSQGQTLDSGVVYVPPANYGKSPIQPSAYVACSRVRNREKLTLANCGFLNAPVRFFTRGNIDYKYSYEMGYAPTKAFLHAL